MFEKKFSKIGRKIDNSIEIIQNWYRKSSLYKVYVYFVVKNWIKDNRFKNEEHFINFLNILKNKHQIWRWEYNRLLKIYKNSH